MMIRKYYPGRAGIIALITLFISHVLMFLKIEPFFTWFYLFAWWSYIILIDSIVYNLNGNSLIRSRGKEIFILSTWSVVFWLIFETVNFFLKNWHYINLPANDILRNIGIVMAFATVLPGIFITKELLEISTAYKQYKTHSFNFDFRLLSALFITGLLFAFLSLRFPQTFSPLIWGSFTLILEPLLYVSGGRSLLKDLEKGNPRKILILLTSGLICGFLWEFWNFWAYSKWVYTIPYLNDGKIFEMPVAGFLGFPPFAIDCYVMYNFVCLFRKGPGWEQTSLPPTMTLPKPIRLVLVPILMTIFSITVIHFMEIYTIRSYQAVPVFG